MSCELAHEDAAYVLGALSPAERSAYQRHLAGCEECTRAVRSLAGIPGLLARIPADVLESSRVAEPVPQTLLPALVDEVRRRQQRRTGLAVAAAAAAAVVVTAGTVVVGQVLVGDGTETPAAGPTPSAPSTASAASPMYSVRPLPISADIALTSVAWGTRLDLTCSYDRPDGEPKDRTWRYALVVKTKDGETEQVATWLARPGRTYEISGATASSKDEIYEVEVQTPQGEPLLKWHA